MTKTRHGIDRVANKRVGLGLILGALFLVIAACGPSSGPFGEYYVSPSGSDSSGDGSAARPWQTIQYALDHVDYSGEDPPRINLARGIYHEDLDISRSIVLVGVGVADVLATAGDPNMPTENVSAIWRTGDPRSGGGQRVHGDISAEFQDLVFYRGGVAVDGAGALFSNVEFQDVQGLFGLQAHNSPLTRVLDTRLATPGGVASDLGIDIDRSTVVVDRSELGDMFDHVIDINTNSVVTVQNSTIWGSALGLADGIRIHDVNEVSILNNRIIRDHPDAEPALGTQSGIEIAGHTTSRPDLVTVRGNEVRGFQVGLRIASEGNRVLAQDNTIDALLDPIQTFYVGYSGTSMPVVDFGGGPLGSSGGNSISASGEYGFEHQGPYDVMACDNDWNVPSSDIPDRIYDQEDDPDLGRVRWMDCSLAREVGPPAQEVTGGDEGSSSEPLTEGTIAASTPTPETPPTVITDSLCWKGPGSLYEVVSSLQAGTQVQILGRGVQGDWWVIDNPRYAGVRCWAPGEDIEVLPNYEYPNTLFEIPPLPTPTATAIMGCLYQGQNDQQAMCYPIDQCPVDFGDSQGACTP